MTEKSQIGETNAMTIAQLRTIEGTTPLSIKGLASVARKKQLEKAAAEKAQRDQENREARRASAIKMHGLLTAALDRFFEGQIPSCQVKWHYDGREATSADLDFSGSFLLSAVFIADATGGNTNIAFQYEGLYLADMAHLGEMIEASQTEIPTKAPETTSGA